MKNLPLTFKVGTELQRVVEHTMKGKAFKIPYTLETVLEPTLWLVHDEGVYLMSASTEKLPREGGNHLVAYAEGCHPEKDEDCWVESRRLIGGDDFGMDIPAAFFAEQIAAGATAFKVLIQSDGQTVELTAVIGSSAVIPVRPPPQAGGPQATAGDE